MYLFKFIPYVHIDGRIYLFLSFIFFFQLFALKVYLFCYKWQDFILSIPLCIYTPSVFIHSLTDGHLGSFCILAVVNTPGVNMGVQIPF